MRLPSAGKGSSNANPPIINLYDANSNIVGSNTVQAQSMLTQILPFIELGNVQDLFQDLDLAYNDTANVIGAQSAVDAFICPTSGGVRGSTERQTTEALATLTTLQLSWLTTRSPQVTTDF